MKESRFHAHDGVWLLRVGMAATFAYFGVAKFGPHNESWIEMFDAIGWGQWFRYFTGAVEMSCAVLILMRRTMTVSAGVLACTMIGAIGIRLILLRDSVGSLAVPVGCLAILAVILGNQRKLAQRPKN